MKTKTGSDLYQEIKDNFKSEGLTEREKKKQIDDLYNELSASHKLKEDEEFPWEKENRTDEDIELLREVIKKPTKSSHKPIKENKI